MGAALLNAQAPDLWSHCSACGTVIDCSSAEWLQCEDNDGEFGGRRRVRGGNCSTSESSVKGGRRRRGGATNGGGRQTIRLNSKVSVQRLEDLTKELFTIHDLNRNGFLEEEELISLNERIAVLHHGKGFDTSEVRSTYRNLFREKLDPEGRPVAYDVFRRYALEVLHGLDDDPEAQEMILEQFVAEAQSGAALLGIPCVAIAAAEEQEEDATPPGSPTPCSKAGHPKLRIDDVEQRSVRRSAVSNAAPLLPPSREISACVAVEGRPKMVAAC